MEIVYKRFGIFQNYIFHNENYYKDILLVIKMNQIYSPGIGKQITDKIHEKGWNIYKSTESIKIGFDEVITKHFAEELEIHERYVVLPKADDPRNPLLVLKALENLAILLNRGMPTIVINGERWPWTGFIPRISDIKVNTNIGHHISYPRFIESLDSIMKL